MIEPTMQLEEVLKEMLRDYPAVHRKSCVQGLLFQKEMRRKNLDHEIRITNYKSQNNNNWTVVVAIFQDHLLHIYYVETNDAKGKVAYTLKFTYDAPIESGVAPSDIWMIKYNSHFFKRYRERSHPDNANVTQLIKYFFKHNFDSEDVSSDNLDDGSQLVRQINNEGLCIGWQDEARKVIHFKSFLPQHMLNKGQQNLVAYIKEHNDHEEFAVALDPKNNKNKF